MRPARGQPGGEHSSFVLQLRLRAAPRRASPDYPAHGAASSLQTSSGAVRASPGAKGLRAR
eukprot:415816-Alexandrium_andersonii.AAC.1